MTLNGFDWWVLVIIPIVVGLLTYYAGKLLDIIAGRSFKAYRRWSVRRDVEACARNIHHVADGNIVPMMISRVAFLVVLTGAAVMLMLVTAGLLVAIKQTDNNSLRVMFVLSYITGLVSLVFQINILMSFIRLRTVATSPIKYVSTIRARTAEFAKDYENEMLDDLEAMAQYIMHEREERYTQMYFKGSKIA